MSDSERPILWDRDAVMRATHGVGAQSWSAHGVSIDTRDLALGDLFVALRAQRDGHEFLSTAFARGASAALVDTRGLDAAGIRAEDFAAGPLFVVEDTLAGLVQLGRFARQRSAALRIGVTGSVGKTSVKEMIATILAQAGPSHHSVKSYNNHWGVPLTLARMPVDTQRAVFEMGMNAPGEIRDLVAQVRPHIALITRIAPAHLERLGSIEAIAAAKAEIFTGFAEADPHCPNTAIIPGDDDFADYLAQNAQTAQRIWRFGLGADCEARLLDYADDGTSGMGRADILGQRVTFTIGAGGNHWGLNAIAAILAAHGVGVDVQMAADRLSTYFEPPAGRGQVFEIALKKGGHFTLIDDAYNANPASMNAALAALANRQTSGRKWVALGEMRELGEASADLHRALWPAIEAAGAEGVFLAGGAPIQALWQALPADRRSAMADHADALIDAIEDRLQAGDILLVKGSNASGMMRIVAHFRGAR